MIGLISEGLVSHANKVSGLDTSQAMVDIYNRKAVNNGLSAKMHATCIDILSSEIPGGLQNVDVVVCSMAYHHIEDIDHTSKVLASLLKKGGHLFVVDLLQSFPACDVINF
jgi:2-polyprenyl-3-methyl-5-hydroxy-6-metoxy-1,4-benzoquinol methylase